MPAALVIEDEPELATFVCAIFNRFGLETIAVESVAEGVGILEKADDIAVLLLNLSKDYDQLELAKFVTSRRPAVKLIFVSSTLASLRELPPVVFLAKPTTSMALIAIIEHVVRSTKSNAFSPDRGRFS